MATIQQIENYYNTLVYNWLTNNKTIVGNDPYLSQCASGSGLLTSNWFSTMPEPYYGDADNNLVVSINLNPGYSPNNLRDLGKRKMSKYLGGGYSAYAKPFPYINGTSPNDSGNKWWQSRHKSLLNLVKQINPVSAREEVLPMPFDVELCPWHSKKWVDAKIELNQKVINNHIEPYVLDFASYALRHSKFPYIIAVGKNIHDVLVNNLGFKKTKEWDQNSYIPTWPQKKKNNNPIIRSLCLLYKDGICVFCTWAPGRNNLPGEVFYKIIKQFLQMTITFGVIINNNDEQIKVEMDAADALRLIELFNQAETTVLKSVPDEDRHLAFDPWLKAQDPMLYKKALEAFHIAFSIRLGESYVEKKELYDQTMDIHVPCAFDDSYYLEDSNDVRFNYFEK